MASSSADAMETDEPVVQTHAQRTRAAQIDSLPWVEKYRPKVMSDLVSHEQIIGTITRCTHACPRKCDECVTPPPPSPIDARVPPKPS